MDRNSLSRQFVADGRRTWKTYVLEAHPKTTPEALLREAFPQSIVEASSDVHLLNLNVGQASYVVDTLEDRFWSFHTSVPANVARRPIAAAASRRHDLDFVWLPSAHLRAIERHWRTKWISSDFRATEYRPAESVHNLSFHASGGSSQQLLDAISQLPEYTYALSLDRVGVTAADELLGTVEEAVTRKATFLASGESFPLHQLVVADTIQRYRRLVEAAEVLALGFDRLDEETVHEGGDDAQGGRLTGSPIEFRFSKPLVNFDSFLSQILCSRAPFRLWGIVEDYSERYVEVEAVDLHVGSRIRLEMSPEMIRIHLRRGGCGNTVARLVSNLQHHVDGNITATDEDLQAQFSLNAA
jgi:hypothetical protein